MRRLRTLGKQLRQPVSNERGIAILIAVACIMMIMYFAMEITYDSNVEYIVNSQGLNRTKAYYAAKAGVELSLIRIKIFQKVSAQVGSSLGSNAGVLDEIWRFPFSWPLPVADEMNAVDKDNINKMVGESLMDASYLVTIEDEGSKIDLNDLNSVSKVLRDTTKKRLLAVFEQRKKTDPNFDRSTSNTNFEELVNSIQDWMSPLSRSETGKDKVSTFQDINQAAGQAANNAYPPNRAFRTMGELRMIPGMNDLFYSMLEPLVTIYGMKGINPNLANKEVLKSLDPGITDEVADEIIKRRGDPKLGGPYKDSADFWGFVTSKQARLENDPKEVPLIFDGVMNFRIRSTGQFAGVSHEITAITMDIAKTASKVNDQYTKEKQSSQSQTANPSANPTANPAASPQANQNKTTPSDASSKGPPRIVFWGER